MKKSRFTKEQIVFVLKQAELGTSVPEVCQKLEEENLWLKQLVADLSLDKAMLQDVLAKRTDAGC